MQELTFEQVQEVSGGSRIKNNGSVSKEAHREEENQLGEGVGGGDWFTPGSGEFTCCFGADLFKVNLRNIAADLGSFTNPNLMREQSEAKQLQ